ncbi:MAG: hypothetical protein HY055_04955 [Magnetospirillum sp.]|nr:hypothetical protein [Magnetospirillum sp.]
MPTLRLRLLHLLMVLMVCLGGCAPAEPPAIVVSEEEREEFRQEILADMDKIDTFLQKSRRGVNISEMSLGWFVMILLNELSAQDGRLFDHIHHDDANAELYLRNDFQTNPAREIAAIDAMARDGRTSIRLAAREALICLTSLPDNNTPVEVQVETRTELVAALLRLRRYLAKVAQDLAPQSP